MFKMMCFLFGSIEHDEIFKFLNDMDIYIQPSLQEGLPRAVLEALSMGLPVIGSKTGGIPEIVRKKDIFKKRNVKQIVNILENIDKNELKEMSKYSFEKIKEFDVEKLDNIRKEFYK